jgi:hypothetical protein
MKKVFLPDKVCEQCGALFNRTLRPSGVLEGPDEFIKRRFCSSGCYHAFHRGSNHHAFKVEGSARYDGYIRVSNKGSRVYLHRKIMADKVGRPILPTEHVHHKDGNPSNNDPSNLELIDGGKHSRMHDPQRRRDPITKRYAAK